MRLFLIVIYLGFIFSAKRRPKHIPVRNAGLVSYESDELMPLSDDDLNLRGSLRRDFAIEAALVDHNRNMICSPVSVLIPLGKLAMGAERRTERELLKALGLKSNEQLRPAFAQLITSLQYLPGVTLDVANRIYVSHKDTINKKFAKETEVLFKSSVEKIKVTHPKKTAHKINSWVAHKTRNKIKNLISARDITKETSVILVNAIYFAGKWLNEFEKTFTDDFFSPSGRHRIPMMSRTGTYLYWKSDSLNAHIIEIPYEGEQSSMIIVLPYNNDGLGKLLQALKLAPQLLNKDLGKMKFTDIILTIPKFKIESEMNLNSLYKKVGVKTMFDKKHSGLTKIVDGETLYVSKAIHKAIIEVNEKGTVAAAATGVIINLLSAAYGYEVKVNHPFLFYIKAYQEQLFAGVFNATLLVTSMGALPPEIIKFAANHPFYFIVKANREQLFTGIFNG